jgi:hypothetical protein
MIDKLIAAGVKNIKTFGYPGCNKDNILTDPVYKEFFASMLRDKKGNGKEIDKEIDLLLEACKD